MQKSKNSKEPHAQKTLHQCKECKEKLPNFMQLLKHIAQHHGDNQSKNEVIQLEEQEKKTKLNIIHTSGHAR